MIARAHFGLAAVPTPDQPRPRPDGEVRLTNDQLITVLHALAQVAQGDSQHDFGTVLDVYNDQQRRSGKPTLSVPAALQIARAVRASISGDPEVGGLWRDNALFINDHLRGLRPSAAGSRDGARRAFRDLLTAAADFVGSGAKPPGSSESPDLDATNARER